MARIAYVSRDFSPGSLRVIQWADRICQEYAAAGYSLTLRQLFYQGVARGFIPNRDTEYKRLGSIVNDARMAGLLDWNYIVDRTREVKDQPHWSSPDAIMEVVAEQYRIPKWADQPVRMEVWIEKEALLDVIRRPAEALDIPYFACRGYNSQSNAWAAAQRIIGYLRRPGRPHGAERVVILHLGDHDPSGIDMTRDIRERFNTFLSGHMIDPDRLEIRRIALNMDQVRQYDPPPNPAKMTDSRVGGYIDRFGYESWELDALDPPTIDALIRDEVEAERNGDLWLTAVEREATEKHLLQLASKNWGDVQEFLEGINEEPDDEH